MITISHGTDQTTGSRMRSGVPYIPVRLRIGAAGAETSATGLDMAQSVPGDSG